MKITKKEKENKLNTYSSLTSYDYYLGLDWSQDGYSLARLTSKSKAPKYSQGKGKVECLQEDLSRLRGKKLLTIEETTSTHWLYVESYTSNKAEKFTKEEMLCLINSL